MVWFRIFYNSNLLSLREKGWGGGREATAKGRFVRSGGGNFKKEKQMKRNATRKGRKCKSPLGGGGGERGRK